MDAKISSDYWVEVVHSVNCTTVSVSRSTSRRWAPGVRKHVGVVIYQIPRQINILFFLHTTTHNICKICTSGHVLEGQRSD